jgi:hypothetical protein
VRANGALRAPIQTPSSSVRLQLFQRTATIFKRALTPITPRSLHPQVEKFLKSNAGKKMG